MTKEERQLLLNDLCGRLPYGLNVSFKYNGHYCRGTVISVGYGVTQSCDLGIWPFDKEYNYVNPKDIVYINIDEVCRLFLRPPSSMTEEERSNLRVYCGTQEGITYDIGVAGAINSPAVIDFLNAHYFDYRGLIEKGLAFEAPEGMYKK